MESESQIMDLLVEAHNIFLVLPNQHPTAIQEWVFYLHGLQGLLEHRQLKEYKKRDRLWDAGA
jgi:hypothetical protein